MLLLTPPCAQHESNESNRPGRNSRGDRRTRSLPNCPVHDTLAAGRVHVDLVPQLRLHCRAARLSVRWQWPSVTTDLHIHYPFTIRGHTDVAYRKLTHSMRTVV